MPRLLAGLSLALLLAACDGDGGGLPTDPGTPTGRSFVFQPAAVPGSNTLSLRGNPGYRPGKVTLDVVATDFDDVERVVFAFEYPAELVELSAVVLVVFGVDVEVSIPLGTDGFSGTHSFEISSGPEGFSGSGVLMRYVFDYRGPIGSGAVTFTEGAAFDPRQQPVPTTFFGGTLVVD